MSKKKHITSKNYKLYLEDILDASIKIESYVTSLTFEHFSHYNMAIDAVTRNLMIIGEAAKNIPLDVQKNYPSVEWKKIAGFRDIIVHAYFVVDLDKIWNVIKDDLPKLKKDIKKIIKELNQE